MGFLEKERSLAQSEPYELHAFWKGDYKFPYYPILRTTTNQPDPGLTHTIPISDVNDLQDMNLNKAGNYYLTNDIDASGTISWNGGAGFVPIGTAASQFSGTLDGCGFTISGLFIDRNAYGQSLLGYLEPPAKVANLTLANVDITGGIYYCGALAGEAEAADEGDILIQNCHATGTITKAGGMGYYGGLIGQTTRKLGDSAGTVYVYDCSCSCALDMSSATLYSYRGGLIGLTNNTIISNCYATGSLTGGDFGDQYFGGLIGRMSYSTASFCHATGNVIGAARFSGGLVGGTGSYAYFNSCYATGNATGSQEVGGFVGHSQSDDGANTYTDCYAWGSATAAGSGSAGGFAGTSDDTKSTYTNCYSIGSASGSTNIGGFIGVAHESLPVNYCYWDTEISGQATTDGDAIGKTTQEMYDKSTYISWDFDNIWSMTSFGSDELWLYADAPYDIEYNGNIYTACYITGDKIEEGSTRIKSRTKVRTNWNNPFVWQYTTNIPGEIIHYKRYRGQGSDVQLVYAGDVLSVEFHQSDRKGNRYAEITIEPPRAQLGEMGLITRYSRQCTVELYSGQCGVNPASYKESGTLDSYDGNVLTSTTFGGQADGYWEGGYIVINNFYAKVIEHSGNDVTILPYLYNLSAGDSFDVYPGCNHLYDEDCVVRFNNGANCKCQPNIPLQNIFDEGAMF